jgi:LuxR family transcriptional regulator, quorum-sensing system regulator BjaR1
MRLTPRELEVVRRLATGQRQCDIAQQLAISIRTVESHIASAKRKTATATTLELATRAAVELRTK